VQILVRMPSLIVFVGLFFYIIRSHHIPILKVEMGLTLVLGRVSCYVRGVYVI
jgi:hypothetical protein